MENKMRNFHQRSLLFSIDAVGKLLDSLAGPDDRLWPKDVWPSIRLDRGLAIGSTGGHGQIRYSVEHYEPGRSVGFRFAPGLGIEGMHTFQLADDGKDGTMMSHVLEGKAKGAMLLLWPLAIRWMHDAVIEDAFDNAEAALRGEPIPSRNHTRFVKFLKRSMSSPKPDGFGRSVGTVAAITIEAIGLLHLAWGFGLTAPAATRQALAQAVVGTTVFPSTASCVVVAALLGAAGVIVAGRAHPKSAISKALPPILSRTGAGAVSAVLALRGGLGLLGGVLGVPATTSTFRMLNLAIYSPLCLALALAIQRIEGPYRRT
jgi:Protein of unknown function (DUF3995)